MDKRGYFFVDGSHLFSSISRIWRKKSALKNKKLDIGILTRVLMNKWSFEYVDPVIRVTYYVKRDDPRLKTLLKIPRAEMPGGKDRWQIDQCGQGIPTIPESYKQKIPEKYWDLFPKEKGLDIKLACDALIFVATGKASNVVFLVNDRDYIPLFKAIQYLGANVYLTGLDDSGKPQKELAVLADKYLTLNDEIESIFGVTKEESTKTQQLLPENSPVQTPIQKNNKTSK